MRHVVLLSLSSCDCLRCRPALVHRSERCCHGGDVVFGRTGGVHRVSHLSSRSVSESARERGAAIRVELEAEAERDRRRWDAFQMTLEGACQGAMGITGVPGVEWESNGAGGGSVPDCSRLTTS